MLARILGVHAKQVALDLHVTVTIVVPDTQPDSNIPTGLRIQSSDNGCAIALAAFARKAGVARISE